MTVYKCQIDGCDKQRPYWSDKCVNHRIEEYFKTKENTLEANLLMATNYLDGMAESNPDYNSLRLAIVKYAKKSKAWTNPQVRMLHNIKTVQSKAGWKQTAIFNAISDAEKGIVY
jgi:hypothetical protein